MQFQPNFIPLLKISVPFPNSYRYEIQNDIKKHVFNKITMEIFPKVIQINE